MELSVGEVEKLGRGNWFHVVRPVCEAKHLDCIAGHQRKTPKDFNLGRGAFRPVLEDNTG